jgi:spore maturation protein CgeB
VKEVTAKAAKADIVVVTSGIGYEDDTIRKQAFDAAGAGALKIFWDVDAPATLAELNADPHHPLHGDLPRLDMVMTYGGGDPVVYGYRALGAAHCFPIYNALDPETHHPVLRRRRSGPPVPRDQAAGCRGRKGRPRSAPFAADLSFLGNRLPDREERVDRFFFDAARALPKRSFLLGGSGWADKHMPENVRYVGHVSTRDHNAFNVSAMAVLNINRSSMATNGYSPATRVFEAAGAGACLITDSWVGLDLFLNDGEEVLAARDGQEVAEILDGLTPEKAKEIGSRARERILRGHTYAHRAAQTDRIFRRFLGLERIEAAE